MQDTKLATKSEGSAINRQRLLARFLRYVQVDTTAREGAETYPSSLGQLDLGRQLVAELRSAGIENAAQDEHGVVTVHLAATVGRTTPTILFNAHLDTSPETTGAGVRPQVWENYDGRDLVLPGDPSRVIRVAEDHELARLTGATIITSDGTTLLGADDKAGVAVIMETICYLAEHPRIEHGAVWACFTCDEEIGRGTRHVDLAAIPATVCYTLDGHGTDEIDVETFSADLAVVKVTGVNIHPAIGKGRMVNAVRVAADFVARLPRDRLSPETTDQREGFLHPYRAEGGVGEMTLRILLRDFETAALAQQAALLRTAAAESMAAFPGSSIEIDVSPQYRNMAEGLAREPRAVAYAEEALQRLGREPKLTIVRGGTDGAQFTAKGLPSPNLSTGEHNLHSPLEWTCLEEMLEAVEMLVELVRVWAEKG